MQGVLSGTRSTDSINTFLYKFYFEVARALVRMKFGVDLPDLYHVHQGDDSFVATKSVVGAALVYVAVLIMGAALAPEKQLAWYIMGEYLRVFNLQGTARGFLLRALGSFLDKPVQEARKLDLTEAIKTVRSQVSVLIRRGMDIKVATLLYSDQLKRLTKVTDHRTGKTL